MVNFTILAGGFSTFIATYVFDSDANVLSLTQQTTTGTNPSWIAAHPTNSSILYSVNEASPVGALQSFTINPDATLNLVDTISTEGNGPTFTVMLSTGEVTGMNFGSPNASFMATDPNDNTKFIQSPDVTFPVFEGGKSNPHMSLEVNGEVLVPDLGGDKIWRVVSTGTPGNFAVQGQINVDPGTGPRHAAFSDGLLFVVHETASTLTVQQIPEGPNGTTLPLIANVTTVDPKQAAINGTKFAAAEILISQPSDQFPESLIYVSNRNIGSTILPEGDTIAIFKFTPGDSTDSAAPGTKRMIKRTPYSQKAKRAGGSLELIAQIPTGLQQIRSMAIGNVVGTNDQFLIAGANTNGGVAMFQRVDGGRNLTLLATNTDTQNRTSFVFL